MTAGQGHDAVRLSYDAVAQSYEDALGDELSYKPLDRGLLSALLEQSEPGWPIADIGCGPGHVAAFLASHGAAAVGIDLSPAMVAVGRSSHPDVQFRQGDMVALPATDGEFASAVALYSIIHLQPSELGPAFSEVHRALRPRGLFLVSFHLGTQIVHRSEWWGHQVDIDFRFYEKGPVIEALVGAGFSLEASLERSNYPEEVETLRAYLLGRRGG
jgi:SAM-dependent methyltransferase